MKLDFNAYIIDLDGCIFRGNMLIPGADEVIVNLRTKKRKMLFLTNNSTASPSDYSTKLKGMGVDVNPHDILTSSIGMAMYMRKLEKGGVYVIGEKALKAAIAAEGFQILREVDAKKAKYVVSGLDRKLTYDKVSAACSAIFIGAKYLATNTDPILPYEGGQLPGAGAIVSMILRVTNKRPLVIGKPSTNMITIALNILGTEAKQTAIVGDSLDTDIKAGKKMNLFSILTLTGVTKKEDLKNHPVQPDLVLNSIKDLVEYI
jgi:4-nitrophenyl phosphatase